MSAARRVSIDGIGEVAILRATCEADIADLLPLIASKIHHFSLSYVVEGLTLQCRLQQLGKPCLSWEALRLDQRLGHQARTQLAQVHPQILENSSDVETRLQIISQHYVTRNLVPTHNQISKSLGDPETLTSMADLEQWSRNLEKAKLALQPTRTERARWACTATTSARGYLDAMLEEDDAPRIATPWRTMNELTRGGVQRGDLMAIAAGSGGAKSTLATYFAMHAYQAGQQVVYWNGENRPSLQRRDRKSVV